MKVVVLLLFMILASTASADVILASGHPDWSPVMYRGGEDGEIILGIGPELVAKIMSDIGIPIKCPYVGSWENVQEMGKRAAIDIIVAAYKTDERQESFEYSDDYWNDPISLFTIKPFKHDNDYDLLGHSIAVTKGDSYGKELDDFLESWAKEGYLTVNKYNDIEEMFYSLQTEDSDVALYSSYAGRRFIKENSRFRNINESAIVGEQKFYILISKKSKYIELMPLINNHIALYKNNGEMDKIIESVRNDTGFQ